MDQLLTALPALAGLIEKGGIVGLLVIFTGTLIWDRIRLMKELKRAYRGRDRARIERERFRSACVAANITVDISDVAHMFDVDDSSVTL
jgi:hypothetical protein